MDQDLDLTDAEYLAKYDYMLNEDMRMGLEVASMPAVAMKAELAARKAGYGQALAAYYAKRDELFAERPEDARSLREYGAVRDTKRSYKAAACAFKKAAAELARLRRAMAEEVRFQVGEATRLFELDMAMIEEVVAEKAAAAEAAAE